MLVVPELVGQHGDNLVVGHLVLQGVVEYDALLGAEAREIGVGLGRMLAAVDDVDVFEA